MKKKVILNGLFLILYFYLIKHLLKNYDFSRDGETAVDEDSEGQSTIIRPSTAQAPTMMDIGTRSIFNEDHDIFRTSVRKFFTEEVLPYHEKYVLLKIKYQKVFG